MVSIDIKPEHMEQLSKASQELNVPMQDLIDNIFDNFFEFRLPSIMELRKELRDKEPS